MILHLGADTVIRTTDLVAILDANSIENSHDDKQLLDGIRAAGRLLPVSDDPAKAYVLCTREDVLIAYASPISSGTLLKRAERMRK